MKKFKQIRHMISEAKGMNIIVEVKGFKGNMKKFEEFAEEDGVVGLMIGFFDIPEPEEIKYSGNKVILAYDEEDLEDEDTNINKVLKDVRTFCFEQSRSSKATSKVAQNFLKKGGNQSDLEDELDDANIEVDAIYRTAILNGYGDPKKPFAYKASIK